MQDFKQQLKAYSDEMRRSRCPYSEAELDREIRHVIWNEPPDETKDEQAALPKRVNIAKWVAAAAIVAAVVVPTVVFTSRGSADGEIASVKVDGERIYFACNNGCTADATIETFKNLLR